MYYGKLLLDGKNISTHKRWRLLERVILSSLQCDQLKIANDCWLELKQSFGEDSKRTKLLQGMILEKQEE